MFSSVKEALAYIRSHDIDQVELKVVDLQGRWRRMTYSAANLDERLFHEGTGISLSPYPGYRQVEQGDMKVRPDVSTAFIDPFHARSTLAFICDMYDNAGQRYNRDPRYVCQKAEALLESMKLGGKALFSPELEFYILDAADYGSTGGAAYYSVESHGLGWGESQGPVYKLGGFAKIGQADAPLDRHAYLRERMVQRIEEAGIKVKYQHQELGTPGQVEIEVYFDTAVRSADAILLMKYLIKNTAIESGQIVTFMPKPFYGHAGSGMHFHQYMSDGGNSLFYDDKGYAKLNTLAHQYLCGLLEHTPALMGIGNASTNSFRRFAPNLAAPVKLFYGLSNRSSALRIPAYAQNPREARVEFRMPDATANPYLIVAAQLLAGLDGVSKQMDPSAKGYGPLDVNAYALPQAEQDKLRTVPMRFDLALDALAQDRGFLTQNGVFDDDLIDAYLELKRGAEMDAVHVRPHPFEYELYFDL